MSDISDRDTVRAMRRLADRLERSRLDREAFSRCVDQLCQLAGAIERNARDKGRTT